jgi:hypothetical protein
MMGYLRVFPYRHSWLPSTKPRDVPGAGKGIWEPMTFQQIQLIVDESPLLIYPQENARTSAFDEEMERQLQALSTKERDASFDLQPDLRGE